MLDFALGRVELKSRYNRRRFSKHGTTEIYVPVNLIKFILEPLQLLSQYVLRWLDE